MILSEKLKYLRERKGVSQTEISKMLDISISLYSRYEKEIQLIPTKHLNTLSNFYNVSLDYIFSFTNIKQYENSNNEIDIKLTGKRLKEFRKENKLTQEKLSSILNTVHSVITKCENGSQLIATPFLYDICKKYNISADYLLGKTDSPKYL